MADKDGIPGRTSSFIQTCGSLAMSANDNQPRRFPDNALTLKSSAFHLRSKLGAVEQRIAALETQMALLHKEREQILGDLAAIVYPVLTLPTDITSEIFLRYVDRSPRPSPLRLASICRLWRAIALSTCRLWTHLDVGIMVMSPPGGGGPVGYTSAEVVNRLDHWLPRAGGLPVDLRIKLPPSPTQESDAILRILSQYSSRWRSLEILSDGPISFPVDLRGPFSSIVKISLESHPSWDGLSTITALDDASRLREVCMSNIALEDWRTSLPWSQLTTLDLSFITVDECLGILADTPNLEVLTFSSFEEQAPFTSTPHILHHLRTIQVGSDCSYELLDYLILPSLAQVHLGLNIECAQRVAPLIERSGCSPRTLGLYIWGPDIAPILECICSLPSVCELQMTWCGGTGVEFNNLFKTLAEDPSVMPALESVNIEDCEASIDLPSLVQMLATRTTGMDSVAKLKSFRISFSHEDPYEYGIDLDKDVELALDRLSGLRSQGLQVKMQSSIKWFSTNIDSKIVRSLALGSSAHSEFVDRS
ncbi:hypothetical protein B0H17DRAFT_702759 [Mycena rosella]|uniref:F-box domain-containing protein n=1 Tax=Mycena rosella TaxID=1033263 RepID=A0AAD7DAC8_MYCRO|nr:hypothetical protein B0H17DRAFT_702759 [Mycena rosella]